jgi:PAS domain S-box-containing protein
VQKNADAELSEFEELFRQAPAFFAVLVGPDYVFERANEAYLTLVGGRDIIGKPLFEALPEVRGQGFVELLDGVVRTGKPYIARALPATIITKPGKEPEQVFVDLVYAPLRGADGSVIGIIAYGSDVTEQVRARQSAEIAAERLAQQVEEAEALAAELEESNDQLQELNAELEEAAEALARSEEQFRALANLIPTLAWIADATGWIYWYNDRWYEYTGTSPEEMKGWGWQSVHDPAVLPDVMERWTSSIATGQPFEMEFPLRSATGELRWFLTRVAPVKDAAGAVTRWFGLNTDVQAQHEATEAANAANKAKSDFLAAISHETRQPINATLSFLQLFEMGMYGEVSAEQRNALQRIRKNQEQLLAVITDILSFARLEAGRLELDSEPVPVSTILNDLPSLVESFVATKEIAFSIDCADESAVALGDREKILQILTNLVTNAVRATPKAGSIAVRCVRVGDSVEFCVDDTGVGIPADKIDHIFSPFVQLGRALNKPGEGVGLGLAISRDFAEAMGGSLTAKSTLGEGSTFTLRLPQVQAEAMERSVG